jgi:hypothetical protein
VAEHVLGKDFDEARAERFSRPRTFKMGGEVFTFKVGFRPETFTEYVNDYYDVILGVRKATGVEILEVFDSTIVRFLDPIDRSPDRWEELRARHEPEPDSEEEVDVTLGDMRDLLEWLIAQQANRPTRAPSSSGNGRETTGQNSTGRSSSAQVVSEA